MPMLASRAAAALRNWGFSGTTLISRLRDTYWKYVTLLLRGNNADVDYALTASPDVLAFNRDSSSNNFALTLAGDTKPSVYNPYQNGYYSCFFDGTGDFLTSSGSTAFTFGANDFTVEYWVYHTAVAATYNQHVGAATTASGFAFGTNGTALKMYMTTSTTGYTSTGTSFVLNRWHHVAYCRVAGTVTFFLDGAVNYSVSAATTITETNFGLGAAPSGTSYPMTGYLSNVRVVKGQALYTAQFTPSTVPLTAITGTSLLACQAPRLVDNSPANNTLTKNGDTYIRQAHPFALSYSATVPTGYSVYFDGSGDYITLASNSAFNFSTGDFTIEAWIYLSSLATNKVIIDTRSVDSLSSYVFNVQTTGKLDFIYGASRLTSATILVTGRWYHVAVTRVSSVISQFVNGQVDGNTVTYASAIDATAAPWIGGGRADASGNPGYYVLGFISNLRVVKGTGLYTTGFTPSTTALTAVSGTSLLTCQDFVIKDNSTNAFALTRVGDTVASNFHPFGNAATVKIPASSYGVYFDGTGDYLSVAYNSAIDVGTGDFTLECWVFKTTTSADWKIAGGPSGAGFFGENASQIGFGISAVEWTAYYAGKTIPSYQWSHVAWSRSSNTMYVFINGALAGSTSVTGKNYGLNSGSFLIGSENGSYLITGCISNFRLVKGTGLYTAAFTPSSSPLTAVSGTGLLTCQSSTIIDNSGNAFTITANGDARPVYVNIVDPSTGLDTRYLGSAYFDGSGDYIDCTPVPVFGTNDFTIEFWVYPTTAPSTSWNPFLTIGTSGGGKEIRISQNINGTGWGWLYPNNASSADSYTGYGTLPINQWHHIAMVRSGSNLYLFLNGAITATATGISFNHTTTTLFRIASCQPAYTDGAIAGYLSDLRIVIGTALYTTKFIPPVRPLTAVTNTQLLTLQNRGSLSNNFFPDAGSISNNIFTKNGNAGRSTFTPNGGGWSVYFDGAGDYLTLPSNLSDFTMGTGDFTIEMWVNISSLATQRTLYDTLNQSDATGTGRFAIQVTTSGVIQIFSLAGTILTSGGTLVANTWYHIAYSRSSTNGRLYVNGTQVNSTYTDTNNYVVGTTSRPIIGINGYDNSSSPMLGYISNLRLVKGQALYTTTFTPSITPLTPTTSNATAYTSMLTCNDSYLKDWSKGNLTISKAGDAATVRSSPFGNYQITSSGYSYTFSGSGSYLTSSTTIDMYAQPVTIEAWVFPTVAGYAPIVEENTGSSNGEQVFYITTGQVIIFEQRNTHGYGSTIALTTTATAPINTWTHVALCLTSAGPRIYVNGTQSATDATVRYWNNAARSFSIGLNGYGGAYTGYISNLRVSKGVRYTTTFTPSTIPFVADSATSLLTCQSTLIEDTSYTRNTLTMTGTVKPLEFNPFGYNTVEVDNVPTSVGTSLSLDGTGDYLTTTSLALDTGDFTVECWIYLLATTGTRIVTNRATGGGASGTWSFSISNTTIAFTEVVAGEPGPSATISTILNVWTHVAASRSSSTTKLFVNGLQVASATQSTNFNNTSYPVYIGTSPSETYVQGYIYDLRISRYAKYTTPFAPTRSILPATGLTTLSIEPTTVGIYDSAGQRGFSTEGDAKLSVAQKKYGSTSMYFDGTTDYLQFPNMEKILPTQSMMTSSWTWECWVYIVARHTASDSWDWPVLFGGPSNIFAIGPTSIGRLRVQWYIGGSGGERRCTGSSTVPLTTWTHLAVAVTAGAFKFFINGVQETLDTSYSNSQTSFQNNIYTTTGTMYVGGGFGRGDFNGYVDDLRITNGYVRYTANFDAPTALVAAGPIT